MRTKEIMFPKKPGSQVVKSNRRLQEGTAVDYACDLDSAEAID